MNHKRTAKILIVIAFCMSLIFLLQLANRQKVALGVKVGSFNIGGEKLSESKQKLEDKWNEFSHQQINLSYKDYNWSIEIADLGFTFNSTETLGRIYEVGRHSNQFTNIKEQILAVAGRYQFTPSYSIDAETFKEETERLFNEIEDPAQNANLSFDAKSNSYILVPSSEGYAVNRKQLLAALIDNVKNFTNQEIILELVSDYPTVEDFEVNQALTRAEKILSYSPYYLNFLDQTWVISKPRLIEWLVFEPIPCQSKDPVVFHCFEEEGEISSCPVETGDNECKEDNMILGVSLDLDKVETYLVEISKSINRDASNAILKIEGKRAIMFDPGKDGFEVKIDKTLEEVEKNILGETQVKNIQIIAGVSKPEVTLDQINDLGINTLIGTGVSDFSGSPANRKHNIQVGVNKFNGLILYPGEEFSFVNILGGVGPAQGYLPELVIKPGEVIPEYGGGLCQVSTTAFRAAINSGLKVTERRNHAFAVSYYAPHGFDATIYNPKPDLRFVNDTPNHVLVQTYVWNNKVYFNFFGTDDGRKTTIKGPYVLMYKEDGSMRTNLIQEVQLPGQDKEIREFYSYYKSPSLYTTTTQN